MRNLGTLSPHSMSRARTVLAFLLICLGERFQIQGRGLTLRPGSAQLGLLYRFVSIPSAVLAMWQLLSLQKYLDRLQSLEASQGGKKNLDFSKLSNPAYALGRLYFAAFFQLGKKGWMLKCLLEMELLECGQWLNVSWREGGHCDFQLRQVVVV